MNALQLLDDLRRDEGLRLKPYRDTVGKLTIGIGRNLDDVGITLDEAMLLLRNDVEKVTAQLDAALPWWRSLDEPRQRVLANMAFNLGIGNAATGRGLLGFRNTLAAIERGDYASAAAGMLASRWAAQVGNRAVRLSITMRDGL